MMLGRILNKKSSCRVEVVCRRITNDSRKFDAKKKTEWHQESFCENWMDFTKRSRQSMVTQVAAYTTYISGNVYIAIAL